MKKSAALICLLIEVAVCLPLGPDWLYNRTRPLVIANGGSSGHFPEHSLAAYMDAYLSGADFIKLTVQMTSDQVLVVNSDVCLKDETNANQIWSLNTTMTS